MANRSKRAGLALALALAHGSAGCAHQQLTNADVALGAVVVAAVVGLMMLPSVPCDELRSDCHHATPTPTPPTPAPDVRR
jgi:hypothetical protein